MGESATPADAENLFRTGRTEAALAAAEAVLRADIDSARAHIVRVNAANVTGDLARTIDSLQHLVRLHPLHPQFGKLLATALNNRGSLLQRQGDRAAAVAEFQRAITLHPAHPQAWFNLGLCLRDLGQAEAALAALRRHLEIVPDDAGAQLIAAGLDAPDRAGEAIAGLATAVRDALDPGWLANTAARAGMVDAAVGALRRIDAGHDLDAATEALSELRLRGEVDAIASAAPPVIAAARKAGRLVLRPELVAALSLPAIYASEAELLAHRTRFAEGLDRLDDDWTPQRLAGARAPLRQLSHSNFLLAYQGLPDRALQQRFAALIERAAHALQPQFADAPASGPSGRRRVGLLSSCWRRCTVGSYFGGWVGWLRDAGCEVVLYQMGPQRDDHTDHLAAHASRFRYLEGSIESIAEAVRGDALDLLIYPEIGMDARLTPLAALRLARRQAVAWGHPTTSGFTTIDDYLSCAPMEPPAAEQHYSEALVCLPGIGVEYLQPALPEPLPPSAFGLDPTRPRILVPQSLFKLHPQSDAVLVGIAERLPNVQFVLFEPEYTSWRDQYVSRLDTAFRARGGEAARHLHFLPLANRSRYLQANLACDVMLDSLHWSGGNTTIDALCCGLPVVTCPGALMRGRQSSAMLGRLGLDDALSVATPAAQISRVVELATDRERNAALGSAIRSRLPDLFESGHARDALCEWAVRAAAT